MRGGHDSAAGVRSPSSVGHDWPTGAEAWVAYAAEVTAEFPLAATDWVAHSDCVESGFYSVRNCRARPQPATSSMHIYADEPPLSPDEEEAAAAMLTAPAQMELF